jgi:hypothetical protein
VNRKRVSSRSTAQQEIEAVILSRLSLVVEMPLQGAKLKTGRSHIALDGLGSEQHEKSFVIVEIFAHVGRVKAAQRHKVQADLFKLSLAKAILLSQGVTLVRAIFVMVCEDCAKSCFGNTWISDAADAHGIEHLVLNIGPEEREALVSAQAKQNLMHAV